MSDLIPDEAVVAGLYWASELGYEMTDYEMRDLLSGIKKHIRKAVLEEAADRLSIGTDNGWHIVNNDWNEGFIRAIRELRDMAAGEPQ